MLGKALVEKNFLIESLEEDLARGSEEQLYRRGYGLPHIYGALCGAKSGGQHIVAWYMPLEWLEMARAHLHN